MRLLAAVFWVLCLVPALLAAADTGPASPYRFDTPSRGGIGKFYMGREISHVMGHRGAAWLERDSRNPATLALDLRGAWKSQKAAGEFPYTPPVPILYALRAAVLELKAETIEGRRQRYTRLAKRLRSGMQQLGFQPLLKPGYESWILVTFEAPEGSGWSFEGMHDFLLERGITVYPAKPKAGVGAFRMAVVGDLQDEDIELVLDSVKAYLEDDSRDE
jgi:2-aminoethylphosphonate-pyruvate transaminase